MAKNNKTNRNSYSFVLVLLGVSGPDEGLEDAIFTAGCDDALLAFRAGVGYLAFDRESDSFEAALLSAIRSVRNAVQGVDVSHVEPDDIVNASEIGRRMQWSREYVRLLIQGSRGRGGFPTPVGGVTGKTCLWSWADVSQWLLEQGRLGDEAVRDQAETIREVNLALTAPAARIRKTDLISAIRGRL